MSESGRGGTAAMQHSVPEHAAADLLLRAVDLLVAESPVELPGTVALERLRTLLSCTERLHAVRLAAVRDMDSRELYALDAAGSARGWLRRQPGGEDGQVTLARRLAQRPVVSAALADARVGVRGAAQLCAALDTVPADLDDALVTAVVKDGIGRLLLEHSGGTPEDDEAAAAVQAQRAADEAVLGACIADVTVAPATRVEPAFVLLAERLSPAELGSALRLLLDPLQPDGTAASDSDPYYLELRILRDGDVDIRGLLDPETGQSLAAEIERRLAAAKTKRAATDDQADPLGDLAAGEDTFAGRASQPRPDEASGPLVEPLRHDDDADLAAAADTAVDTGSDAAADAAIDAAADTEGDAHTHAASVPNDMSAGDERLSRDDRSGDDDPLRRDARSADHDEPLRRDAGPADHDDPLRRDARSAGDDTLPLPRDARSPNADGRAPDAASIGAERPPGRGDPGAVVGHDPLLAWDEALDDADDRAARRAAQPGGDLGRADLGPDAPLPFVSAGRQRHNALRDLLLDAAGVLEPGAPAPCHLTVTATLDAVEGRLGALPAELVTTGGTAVPLQPATLQRLGCSSVLDAVLLDARGNPVGASSTRRMPNRRERRAMRARWGATCAVHGCHASRTVPHHVEPWWLSGCTRLRDLVPLCASCHHDLHEGHRTLRLRDGRLIDDHGWVTPERATVTKRPA